MNQLLAWARGLGYKIKMSTLTARRPYVLGEGNEWKLFCLNRCGFRPDLWGTFETLDEAIREALIDEKQQILL